MKNIIYSLMAVFMSLSMKAQLTDLTTGIWSLEKVVINNTDYPFPNTNSLITATASFHNNGFSTSICNIFNADAGYSSSSISITGAALTLGSCPTTNNDEYNQFENHYFGTFWGGTAATGFYQNHTYSITPIGQQLQLTITNPNGDQAIYWRAALSTTENEVIKDNVSISPNPFKDFIQIHFGDTISDFEISMYDMQGKQVFNQVFRKEKSVKIHLPDLEKGVYLFHMKSKDHQISRKVIKK